jgi:hypothetical protein
MAKHMILSAAAAAIITIKNRRRQCDGSENNVHEAQKRSRNTDSAIQKAHETQTSSKHKVRDEIIHHTVLCPCQMSKRIMLIYKLEE